MARTAASDEPWATIDHPLLWRNRASEEQAAANLDLFFVTLN